MGSRRVSKLPEGVFIREHKTTKTINISFMYKGEQCREPLSGLNPALKKDIDHAVGLKLEIERKITKGTFNYFEYFPKSRKLKKFGSFNSKATVGEYISQYIEDAKKRKLSISTINGYIKDQRALSPLHNFSVPDLSPAIIKQFIKSSELSNKTYTNRLSLLRCALNEAIIDGIIHVNPVNGVRVAQYKGIPDKVDTKGNHDDVDPFTPLERDKVIDAFMLELSRNLYQFAFFTGLRPSEKAALKWSQVNMDKGYVFVAEAVVLNTTKGTKTKSSRRKVDLEPKALEALTSQYDLTNKVSDFVFLEPKQKKPFIGADQMRKNVWVPNFKNIDNIRYRYPYQTRHTYATMMISRGENLWWIADQMGHKSPEMLYNHYGKYIDAFNEMQNKED